MRKAASRKLQRAIAEERATRILALHVFERKSQTEIARIVGVSQPVVANVIAAEKRVWAERRNEALDAQRDEALGMLDHLQGLVKRAYDLSCLPAKETQVEQERRLEELEKAEEQIAKAQTKINGKKNGNPAVPKVLLVPRSLRVVGEKDKNSTKYREEGNPKFLDLLKWCVEVRLKICRLLTTIEVNPDNRQGTFIDFYQALVTPPPPVPDDRPNKVAQRIEALAAPVDEPAAG